MRWATSERRGLQVHSRLLRGSASWRTHAMGQGKRTTWFRPCSRIIHRIHDDIRGNLTHLWKGLTEVLLLTKELAPVGKRVASSHHAPRAKVYCASGTHRK